MCLVIKALFIPFFFFIVEISFYTVDEDSLLSDHILYIERRKMYLVHLPSLRIFLYTIDRNSPN